MQGSKADRDVQNTLFNSAKEGEGGMICENGSETYTLPHVKQMTSASSMHEAGHSKPVLWVQVQCMKQGTQSRCSGTTQRDGVEKEVGGGFRKRDTCIPEADSY